MRYKIILSYSGADFCGWQIQPHDPSVQQSLLDALEKLLHEPVELTGAGRTDSGVNATNYVAHFDSESELDTDQIRYKLNAILPESIVIHRLEKTAEEFHARFDATRREYTYFLHTSKDPFCSKYSYLCTYPLDFEKMKQAAALLVGRHDFSCFEKIGADNKTSDCQVFEAYWEKYEPVIGTQGEYWRFKISANRFLRNMVRAIVGTLIEVGRGRRSIEEFASLIQECGAAKNPSGKAARCLSGESAPGHALFLTAVRYD